MNFERLELILTSNSIVPEYHCLWLKKGSIISANVVKVSGLKIWKYIKFEKLFNSEDGRVHYYKDGDTCADKPAINEYVFIHRRT